MSIRRGTLAFLLAFLVVTCALRWWQSAAYPLWVWQLLGSGAVIGLLLGWIRRARSVGTLVLAASAGCAVAFLCVMRTTHVPTPSSIDAHANGQKIAVTGRIIGIDARDATIRYTLDTASLIEQERTLDVHGKLLVIDRFLYPKFQYGDTISVSGKLERPEPFQGFRYDDYLSTFDLYALMRPDSLKLEQPASGFSFYGTLIWLRQRVSARINLLLPEPYAALLDGLLTGNRTSLPESVLQDFTTAGLTHMLAISGYNIAIIITLIGSILFFLPLRWRLIPSIVAIIVFTIFVGASASVVRAAIMGILGIVALHGGRLSDTRLAVLWTAFFMMAINPKEAWFDPSFQLSFLSVMGLIEAQPYMERFLKYVPETLGIRDALALTLAAQLFAAPWGALLFGQVPLISPLANLLAAPLVPLAMLTGSLALLGSFLWLPLGYAIGMITWVIEALMLWIVHLSAAVPYASVAIPFIQGWHIAVYYALIALLLFLGFYKANAN